MYHALFYSILRYGILEWGGANKNNIKQVESIQIRVLKDINNKPMTYPTDLLYKESRHLNIKETFGLQAIMNLCSNGKQAEKTRPTQKETRQTKKHLIKIPVKKSNRTENIRIHWN